MKLLKNIKNVYKTKDAVLFLIVMLLFGLSYGYYRGVQDNYLANIIHVNEFERGIIEFLREMPGLFLVFIIAFFHRFNEQSILKISILICAVAVLLMAVIPTMKVPFVALMVLFSVGEHMIMPSRSSVAMHTAEKGKEGLSLGIVTSVGNIGTVGGYAITAGLFMLFPLFNIKSVNQFRVIFLLSALALVVALLIMIFSSKKNKNMEHIAKSKLYFRKKFNTFYILELFYGARKQVFLTFGPYVLILIYGADTKTIATLYAVSAISGILFMPLIGKCIDTLGYKFVMVADTIVLIFVCLVYGFAHKLFPVNIAIWVVMINFVLDIIISQASIAASVYVKELSVNKEEVSATLTTGISINHVMSILIALLGGAIWRVFGVELLFIFAAICALGNSLFALTIKTNTQTTDIAG